MVKRLLFSFIHNTEKGIKMKKSEGKSLCKSIDRQTVISIITVLISIATVIINIWTVHKNDVNTKVDRRVGTYTDAVVSLETICFREWAGQEGYGEIINSDVNDEWMKEQLLHAVDIKARLSIFDEKKAKDYWKIVCQIFSPAHTFDHETYEGLINSLKQEI